MFSGAARTQCGENKEESEYPLSIPVLCFSGTNLWCLCKAGGWLLNVFLRITASALNVALRIAQICTSSSVVSKPVVSIEMKVPMMFLKITHYLNVLLMKIFLFFFHFVPFSIYQNSSCASNLNLVIQWNYKKVLIFIELKRSVINMCTNLGSPSQVRILFTVVTTKLLEPVR